VIEASLPGEVGAVTLFTGVSEAISTAVRISGLTGVGGVDIGEAVAFAPNALGVAELVTVANAVTV
jgi:hypothetical protein